MPHRTKDILARCEDEKVHFLRLQFTDILGIIKNVEVPRSQFEKALDGEIMFDGSSIEGFTRIEESDMLLRPDLDTFQVFPWDSDHGRVARLICDVTNPDGSPFAGCPRTALKRATGRAEEMGFHDDGRARGGVLPLPARRRRRPDAADPRHRRLLRPDPGGPRRGVRAATSSSRSRRWASRSRPRTTRWPRASTRSTSSTATPSPPPTTIVTFRFIVKKVALDYGLHATFMPKPIWRGSTARACTCHQSLFSREGENAFFDAEGRGSCRRPRCATSAASSSTHGLSCAVTNPLVNSYKRLVPGYEAPVNVAWSEQQPLAAGPRSRAARRGHPLRGPHAGPVLQPLPRLRGDAGRGPRRHREGPRLRASRSTRTSSRCPSGRRSG